jgi:spermidine synthase
MAHDVLGFVPGALASAVILFAPAVLCLGAVVPYLVQADTRSLGNVGRRAGDVSAAATAGSIAGTFMTGFVLLPAFPLPVLLALTAVGLLTLAALSGVILGKRVQSEVLALVAISVGVLGFTGARRAPGTLYEQQTLYASVSVTESVGLDDRIVRALWQNGGSSSAEFVDTGDPAHEYVDASGLLLEPVIHRVRSMLVLGGAALSLPTSFSRWRPDLHIDVVEIDPVVTELAEEFFAYGRDEYPNIRVMHGDARVHLHNSEQRYDLIYLDIFDHLLTVPWTMVTVEALTEMAEHLESDGLLVVNLLSPLAGPGQAFIERFQATLNEVFPVWMIYPATPDQDAGATQNLIVIVGLDPQALPDVDWPLAATSPAGRPLTDAWAPVEYLQAKVFLAGLEWD